MSAFIVPEGHIDYLVSCAIAAGIEYGQIYVDGEPVTIATADAVGRMLARQNHRSVRHRYSHRDNLPGPVPTPDPDAYVFRQYRRVTILQGLQAIACYEYQSCETPDWTATDAARFCDVLRHALIGCLPGYREQEWVIDERGSGAWVSIRPGVDDVSQP